MEKLQEKLDELDSELEVCTFMRDCCDSGGIGKIELTEGIGGIRLSIETGSDLLFCSRESAIRNMKVLERIKAKFQRKQKEVQND